MLIIPSVRREFCINCVQAIPLPRGCKASGLLLHGMRHRWTVMLAMKRFGSSPRPNGRASECWLTRLCDHFCLLSFLFTRCRITPEFDNSPFLRLMLWTIGEGLNLFSFGRQSKNNKNKARIGKSIMIAIAMVVLLRPLFPAIRLDKNTRDGAVKI